MFDEMINFLKTVKQFVLFFVITISLLLLTPYPALASENSGAAIFEANCAGCHSGGGNIIRRGKNLKAKALKRNHFDTIEAISSLVTQGKNNMPAYEERLNDREIESVSNYVIEQAAKNWRN